MAMAQACAVACLQHHAAPQGDLLTPQDGNLHALLVSLSLFVTCACTIRITAKNYRLCMSATACKHLLSALKRNCTLRVHPCTSPLSSLGWSVATNCQFAGKATNVGRLSRAVPCTCSVNGRGSLVTGAPLSCSGNKVTSSTAHCIQYGLR